MKKVMIVLLAVGLMMSVAGCDATVSSGGATGDSGSSGAAAEEKTEFQVGEAINVDDSVMTVVSGQQFTPSNEFDKPSDGKVYYIVNIKIENNGSEPLDYNEFNYKIQDVNGVQTDAAFLGSDVPNKMNSGSLAPGGKLDANIVFEVPADMAGLKLVMEPNFFSTQQVTIVMTP